MTRLRIVPLVAALLLAAPISSHAAVRPDPEPSTPTGVYNVTPMPAGTTCTIAIVPAPFCGPNGPWIGYVSINDEPVPAETMIIMRSSTGGYLWGNNKKGPRTGLTGAGTIVWDNDHYESEVTQGDNTGTKRSLTPV